MPPIRDHRKLLAAILLLALLLRVGWGLTRSGSEAALDALPDQREYLSLAENLLREGDLHFHDPRLDVELYAYRTPGYPLFLAACGANPRLALLAQAILDTSTVFAVYLLAVLLAGRASGTGWPLLGALAVALNPFLIYFSGLLLSETLFTTLLAWGMVLLVAGSVSYSGGHRQLGCWIAGGSVLAIAILVRPAAIFLPIGLATLSSLLNRSGGTAYHRRKLLMVSTLQLMAMALVLLPWAYRNRLILHEWIFTTTNGGITLYDGFNRDATGGSDQSFVRNMPQLALLGEVERSRHLGRWPDNTFGSTPSGRWS